MPLGRGYFRLKVARDLCAVDRQETENHLIQQYLREFFFQEFALLHLNDEKNVGSYFVPLLHLVKNLVLHYWMEYSKISMHYTVKLC